jgi:hypothetical protein
VLFMVAGLSILILAGCTIGAPEATPTPLPTATPLPSATPIPTDTPVITPTPADTNYSSSVLGLKATLPGKGWTMTDNSGSAFRGELWLNADKRLVFSPSIITNAYPTTNLQLGQYVNGFAQVAFSPPVDITQADFHSYPSYRVDAVFSRAGMPGDYRFIGHFFIAHARFYFIFAGARVEDWETGGQDMVQAILDSAVIGR